MAKRKRVMRKSSKGKRKKKPKDLPGMSLEKAVARVQQMLDPNSKVTHNRKLLDHLGNVRQYDVVIEGQVGGIAFLGVAECKDHNKKKSPDAVEAFATKCKHLGANLRIMVSRLGFTEQALVVAKAEHIICLSLLPGDPDQTGLAVTATCYQRIGRWEKVQMRVHWPDGEKPKLPESNVFDVRYGGKPIVLWFLKKLATEHAGEIKPGPFGLHLKFDKLVPLDIKDKTFQATGVSFSADRDFTNKKKQLSLYGDAVYDWQNDSLTIPSLGQVFTGVFRGDGSDFDDLVGEIPEGQTDFLEFMLIGHVNQWDPNMEVVDLMAV